MRTAGQPEARHGSEAATLVDRNELTEQYLCRSGAISNKTVVSDRCDAYFLSTDIDFAVYSVVHPRRSSRVPRKPMWNPVEVAQAKQVAF